MTTQLLSCIPKGNQRLTLLCHKGDVNIINDDANSATIDPQATMAMAARIDAEVGTWEWLKGDAGFMKLLRYVFTEKDYPTFEPHPLRTHGNGLRHVVGLIVLIKQAQANGKRPFIVFPETYLHPSAQLGLGDLLSALSK